MKQIILLSLIVVLIPSAMAIHFPFDQSLKQQIDDGLSFNEILCSNNNHVLVERTNEKLACVYLDTAIHFEWIMQDEETRENLWLNNIIVKPCVPKEPGQALTDVEYGNSTHTFDIRNCVWNLKN